MKGSKKLLKIFLATTIIAVPLFLILDSKIQVVKNITLKSPNDSVIGLKIVHFTDVHLGDYFSLKDLDKVVSNINQLEPDLVFFTGDLLDSKATKKVNSYGVVQILSKIDSKYGKYAVRGNHDTRKNVNEYRLIMHNSGFNLLENESDKLAINDLDLYVSGIDDYISGDRDFGKTFEGLNSDSLKLILCHEGDLVDRFANLDGNNYVFSGHTHGGQIGVPFIKTNWLPLLGRKYVKGLYTIKDNLDLYVSSGLGSTGVPFRFNNKPEILCFTFE